MKKLLSLLLVLTMVLSLVSGIGVTAFADEELEVPAEEELLPDEALPDEALPEEEIVEEPPAEEAPVEEALPEEETAEEAPIEEALPEEELIEEAPAEEAPVEEELPAEEPVEEAPIEEALPEEELVEEAAAEEAPVEEEIPAEEPEEEIIDEAPAGANALADGGVVLLIEKAGTNYAIGLDGSAIKAIPYTTDLEKTNSNILWTVSEAGEKNALISIGTYNLYYDSANNCLKTTTESKKNWVLDDTAHSLIYQAGGSKYVVTGVNDDLTIGCVKSGTACVVTQIAVADPSKPTFEWAEDFSTCSATLGEETKAAAITSETKDATCDKPGKTTYTATVTFGTDEFTNKKDKELPALGHDYGDPVYVWAEDHSTCTVTVTCSRATEEDADKHNLTATATLADETITREMTVTPTEEAEGEYTYTATFAAMPIPGVKPEQNYEFAQATATEVIPKVTFHYEEPAYVWAEDNSTCTATAVCIEDAAENLEETVTASFVTTATCQAAGKTTYTAKFADWHFAEQTKEVDTDKLEHEYDYAKTEYTWADDYSTVTASAPCVNAPADAPHSIEETVAATLNEEAGVYESAAFENTNFEKQSVEKPVASTGTNYVDSKGKLREGYIIVGIGESPAYIGYDRNEVQSGAIKPNEDGTVTAEKGNYLIISKVEGGYTMFTYDPPDEEEGNKKFFELTDGEVTAFPNPATGAWNVESDGTLYFTAADGTKLYIASVAAGKVVGTKDKASATKVTLYLGTDKPKGGGGPGGPGGTTVDADAPVFSLQPAAVHYVTEGTDFEAPVFTVEAALPEGSTATSITLQWYVAGEAAGDPEITEGASAASSLTATQLLDKEAGVYGVYCKATCTVDGTDHTCDSYTANFIVCKGVQANSLITFSDVHEGWDDVGTAIKNTIIATNGFIPALCIATGDFNNSYLTGNPYTYDETGAAVQNDNYDQYYLKCVDEIIGRLNRQLAGIDTVWVSGNHDNGYAAAFTNWNEGIDLGIVKEDYANEEVNISGTGIIFDSRSEGYKANADSSQAIDGLVVIGVNFEDVLGAGNGTTGGRYEGTFDYGTGEEEHDSCYKHLQKALDSIAADYNGEPVIISSHAGLHVLGLDPSSKAAGVNKEWDGKADYNINNSAAVVKLVNSYAENYGMDITWYFGHDHSKGEGEFIKQPGDTIVSCVNYDARESEEIELKFTYGHSGYIGHGAAGLNSEKNKYTYFSWDAGTLVRSEQFVGTGAESEDLTYVRERTLVEPGWRGSNADGWRYVISNGVFANDRWLEVDGEWYHFGDDNYMETGWIQDPNDNDNWYFLNPNGAMTTGWYKDENGDWYYMNPNGAMTTGWYKDDAGDWYFMNDNGAMITGWYKDDAGDWYFFGDGGDMQTGWKYDNGSWYYLGSNGDMLTSQWIYDNGVWYYVYADGTMAKSAWLYLDGSWYYFNYGGNMATAWGYIDGAWYYLGSSGDMQTGWKWINGAWYLLDENGVMKSDWYKDSAGNWYYFGSNGAMAAGWAKVGDAWYYFNSFGAMQTGWQLIGGSWYYFDADGAMVTGWLEIGGSWYYFKWSGAMAADETISGYTFDATGAWIA